MITDALPDADDFKKMKRTIHRALIKAIESVALWLYYPDVDITIQVRKSKVCRLDWREVEDISA